jgi:hypothetical protein
MPRQRNDFFPQDLVTVYNSPSCLIDTRTGYPYNMGGNYVGIFLELTEAEAQNLGRNQLHEGQFRFVQIDSGATAANVVQGSIGLMKTLAGGVNLITSYDKGLAPGLRPVVFLAAITATQIAAGAYVFVQEQGDASILAAAGISATAGTIVQSTTGGLVTNGGGGTATEIGIAEATATAGALLRVQLNLPTVLG